MKPETLTSTFTCDFVSLGGFTSFSSSMLPDITNLADLFPKDFNLNQNFDVLPLVLPIGMGNRFNRNGEGVDTSGAMQIASGLAYKFVDFEHQRSTLIGSVLGAGFSNTDNHEIITDLPETDPFYINAACILYRVVEPDLVQAISECADPNSPNFGIYSASWEVRYTDFKIALGSQYISECEIIDDATKFDYKKYLKMEGGTGFTPDGVLVSRIICGVLTPLGFGIVRNPAAYVKGMYNLENEDEDISFDIDKAKKIFTSFIKKSQSSETDVNLDRVIMDEKQLEELIAKIIAKVTKPEIPESTANARQIADEIRKISETWKAEKDAAERKISEADANKAILDGKIKELESAIETSKTRVTELEVQASTHDKALLFSDRMAKVDEKFKLSDELRPLIVDELKSLASDDSAFTAWFTKAQILMKGQEKTEADADASIATVLGDSAPEGKIKFEDLKGILSNAKIEIVGLPNSNAPASTLKDRFAAAFKAEDVLSK